MPERYSGDCKSRMVSAPKWSISGFFFGVVFDLRLLLRWCESRMVSGISGFFFRCRFWHSSPSSAMQITNGICDFGLLFSVLFLLFVDANHEWYLRFRASFFGVVFALRLLLRRCKSRTVSAISGLIFRCRFWSSSSSAMRIANRRPKM